MSAVLSAAMPIPVSQTSIQRRPACMRQASSTPPFRVCRMALSTKLPMMRLSRMRSVRAIRSHFRQRSFKPAAWAGAEYMALKLLCISPTEKSVISGMMTPASSLLTASRSLSVSLRVSMQFSVCLTNSALPGTTFFFRLLKNRVNAKIGWRRSWLAAAINCDMASLAFRALALAAISSSSTCLRSVTSRENPTVPTTCSPCITIGAL